MERLIKNLTLASLLGALLLLISACQRTDPAEVSVSETSEAATLAAGDYRVVIELPGGELPVQLKLEETGAGVTATFFNGLEQVSVPQVQKEDGTLSLVFPAFNNAMTLVANDEGISGELSLTKRGYVQTMPLSAVPDSTDRFAQGADASTDITGRWEVVFVDEEGNETEAVGEFDQDGNQLTGTFMTRTGDYRFLAGNVSGSAINLSTFDGAHAFLFTARAEDDGTLSGDFWSGTKWHETWTATRNFEASLPDMFEETRLVDEDSDQRIEFEFPDLDGNPVSLNDERFQGKVVLVGLSGTWCPNCADEARFLAPYYQENKDRGLAMVGLLFEHFDDFETASRQGRRWGEKHGIDFPLLIAGSSDKARATEAVGFLDRVRSYPTLIFIGRDGTVRKIHTGFTGPGTGEHYREFQREFHEIMESLLAESA